MKIRLQKLSIFSLAVVFAGTPLLAAPPGQATTLQTLWQEDFTLPDSTRLDTGSTGWTSTAVYSKAVYGVISNEFKINNTNSYKGPVSWSSVLINIAGKTDIQLSVTARSSADTGGWLEYDDSNVYDLQLADYIRMYYKVDGGDEILFGDLRSNIKSNCGDTTVYSTGPISGSTVQIIIRARATAADEYYYFDNVTVTGSDPCLTGTPSGVSGFSSDRLTCNTTSVLLTGYSITPSVVYSWSGPGGFSANTSATRTSASGSYLLTVTNPSNGCYRTIPVLVLQDTTPPADVVVGNSGPLTCTLTEVTLSGSSSSSNAAYQWDGPDGYLSFSAEDIASTPGDYILTVTNSDNGCTLRATTTIIQTCKGERSTTGITTNATPDFTARVNNKVYTRQLVSVQ